MVIGGATETVGENLEFNIATANDITVYFNGGDTGSKTSSDDTAAKKYTDNRHRVKDMCIRTNKNIQVLSMNGITFTDPLTIVANGSLTEKLDTPILFKIGIRVLSNDTNIKIRVR